jgi:hypothetical protein
MTAPITSVTKAKTKMEPASAESKSHAPPCPGIITHIETPGPGTGIIITAIPGIVIEPCAVYYGRTVDKGIQVAGSIPHVYVLRGYIIYINVLDIVQRRIWWYPVHFFRTLCRDCPGTGGAWALEPYSIVHCIVNSVGKNY